MVTVLHCVLRHGQTQPPAADTIQIEAATHPGNYSRHIQYDTITYS